MMYTTTYVLTIQLSAFALFFYFSLVIWSLELQQEYSQFIRDATSNKLLQICKIVNIICTGIVFPFAILDEYNKSIILLPNLVC